MKKIKFFILNTIKKIKETHSVGKVVTMLICVLFFVVAMVLKGCNIGNDNFALSVTETVTLTLSCTVYFVLSVNLTVNISNSFNKIENNYYFGNISLDSPIARAYKASHNIFIICSKLLFDFKETTAFSKNKLSVDDINGLLNKVFDKKSFIDEELSVYGSGKRFVGKEKECFVFLTEFSECVEKLLELGTFSASESYRKDCISVLMLIKERYENRKVAPLEE